MSFKRFPLNALRICLKRSALRTLTRKTDNLDIGKKLLVSYFTYFAWLLLVISATYFGKISIFLQIFLSFFFCFFLLLLCKFWIVDILDYYHSAIFIIFFSFHPTTTTTTKNFLFFFSI